MWAMRELHPACVRGAVTIAVNVVLGSLARVEG